MRIYLAARYSRRLELCGYRDQLHAAGHTVQAVWLDGEHQISDTGTPIGESGEALVEGDDGSRTERAAALRSKFAQDDFRDVVMCELLIAFTEPPRVANSRGGRHVELGIALGQMKRVWIVGPRENIFCWLDDVRQFDTWGECLGFLNAPIVGPDLAPLDLDAPVGSMFEPDLERLRRDVREIDPALDFGCDEMQMRKQ